MTRAMRVVALLCAAGLLAVLIAGFRAVAANDPDAGDFLVQAPFLAFMAVAAVASVFQRPKRIEAGGRGIALTRGSKSWVVGWRSIARVTQGKASWSVETPSGTFTIPFKDGGAKLADALQAVIEQRPLYYVPLNDEPAPDTALSRATAPDTDAERGLTRTNA